MLFWSRSGGWEGVEFGLDAVAEFGGYVVIAGHVFGVKDGEGVFDGFHGGGDGRARIEAAVMFRARLFAERDIEMCRGPLHRTIGAGSDLKGVAVGGDGLGEEVFALGRLGASALLLQCDCEVVLGGGPIHLMIGAGSDLKGVTVGGDSLGEQVGSLCPLGADALVL